MFISSTEIATVTSQEFALRLSQWISAHTPVKHENELGYEHAIRFDIDEAIEFCMIKMKFDSTKKEFFPYLVELKSCQVRGMFADVRSA